MAKGSNHMNCHFVTKYMDSEQYPQKFLIQYYKIKRPSKIPDNNITDTFTSPLTPKQ